MSLTIHAHPWYDQQHHRDGGGFRNVWGVTHDIPFWKAAQWMLGRVFADHDGAGAPVRRPDVTLLSSRPEALRLTWLGHSAVYLQTPTLDVIVDPMLGTRASPVSFAGPPRAASLPLLPRDLPWIGRVVQGICYENARAYLGFDQQPETHHA